MINKKPSAFQGSRLFNVNFSAIPLPMVKQVWYNRVVESQRPAAQR
jgi:hypothetical protein